VPGRRRGDHEAEKGKSMNDSHTVYTEKSLEMASDYPLHFAAWLALAAIENRVIQVQEKISARLQAFDRKAMTR
jgi:hypothetical protein